MNGSTAHMYFSYSKSLFVQLSCLELGIKTICVIVKNSSVMNGINRNKHFSISQSSIGSGFDLKNPFSVCGCSIFVIFVKFQI